MCRYEGFRVSALRLHSCIDITHPDLPKGDSVTGMHSTEYSNEEGNQWNIDKESEGHG